MENSTIIAILTIGAGVLIFIFKICFASKCEHISLCCGVLNIDREVSLENKIYRQSSQNENFDKIINQVEEKVNINNI